MSEPVEILIRKSEVADGTAPENVVDKKKEQGKPSLTQGAVNSALINAGKQIALSGIAISADLTGNYHANKKFNYALSGTADLLIIAKGGAVGVIAVTTKHAIEIGNSFASLIKADRQTAIDLQRSGNLAIEGSRYAR